MIRCPKCSKELENGTKFCDNCGTEIIETLYCPNCGNPVNQDSVFCQSCGAPLTEEKTQRVNAKSPKIKRKLTPKTIVFGGIGAAVVAVLLIVFLIAPDSEKNIEDYAVYFKDDEIFLTNLSKEEKAWQVTSSFFDVNERENLNFTSGSVIMTDYTCMNKDGRYIFFPDRVDRSQMGVDLYYRDIKKTETEAVKIDSNVYIYEVNDSATIVTYCKGEESSLYQYRMKDDSREKIGSGVIRFKVSADGSKVLFWDSEDGLYLKKMDEEKEKIAGDVFSLEYVSDDLATVYYVKDETLYKKNEGEESIKIASDVYEVVKVYDTGEIYYMKGESAEVPLMNYVIDDMKDEDASITEPERPDYPSIPARWSFYGTVDEYDAEYEEIVQERERLRTEYQEAVTVYQEKVFRDNLRKKLAESMTESNISLCFFNGSEETVVTDGLVWDYDCGYGGDIYFEDQIAIDVPVLVYEAYNFSNLKKLKLSEISSLNEINDLVESAREACIENRVAVRNVETTVEQEKKAECFRVNGSGTDIYYIDNVPDDKVYGDLYHISISDGNIGKPELYDNDVYEYFCYFVDSKQLEYFKNYEGPSAGDLYINGKMIDHDVGAYDVSVCKDMGEIVYLSDWNEEKSRGTLKIYNGEESVAIADDVHSYEIMLNGDILYLRDYSVNYQKGELCRWNGSESKKIDDDVEGVLPMADGEDRGYTHGW